MVLNKFNVAIICFLLLLTGSTSAASNKKVRLDSLWNAAIEHSSHGRFEQSNAAFEKILKEYRPSGKDKKAVYNWLACNADLSGDNVAYYKYALLQQGGKDRTGELASIRQLAALPPQSVSRPEKDITVEYFVDSLFYEDKFGGCEIRLPVTVGGKQENVILDNGCAKYSVASESFAREHGIREIGADGDAIGVVEKVSMWLGICDSLSISEMTFKNIIFVVIPDKFIENSILNINAMLGANIFRLAGEMVFNNGSRTILFPFAQTERESNVTIDPDGVYFVDAIIDADTLKMQLDLGAARTALSANYFQKYEEKIKSIWTAKTSHIGGVGGFKEETVYSFPELSISSCGGVFVRTDAKVSTEMKPNEDKEDGSIGNDFLLSFDKAVLDLRRQYLYVGQY